VRVPHGVDVDVMSAIRTRAGRIREPRHIRTAYHAEALSTMVIGPSQT
jgi:hypothetical protein